MSPHHSEDSGSCLLLWILIFYLCWRQNVWPWDCSIFHESKLINHISQFNVFPYLLFRLENCCLTVTLLQWQPEPASVLLNLTSLKLLFIRYVLSYFWYFQKICIKYYHGEWVFDVLLILYSKLGLHLALCKPVKWNLKQGKKKTLKSEVFSAGKCAMNTPRLAHVHTHGGGAVVSPVCTWGGSVLSLVCQSEKCEVEQRNRKSNKGRERTKGGRKEGESLLCCVLTRHGREFLWLTLLVLAGAGSIAIAVTLTDEGKWVLM